MTEYKHTDRIMEENKPTFYRMLITQLTGTYGSGEAFEKAKKEGKPMFPSIGYGTCHRFHVHHIL